MNGLILGIAPVFVLIAIGYGLRKSGFLPDAAWRPIEKLSINLLYPGFLVPAIWSADLSGASAGPAGGAAVVSVIVVAALALLAKPPVTNIACVAVLARWGADQRGVSPVALLKAMLKNPILMACLIGLLLNFAGVPPFPVLARILDLLGGAALPLGLIVAGAGLSFAEVMRRRVTVLWVSGVKLMVMPFLMWGVCRLLGGDQLAQALALLCGATPGAAASYMLARQMGGDAPLMAGVIALTTVGGAITMPILLMLFHFV